MIYKCLISFSVIYLLILCYVVFNKFIKPRLEVEHYMDATPIGLNIDYGPYTYHELPDTPPPMSPYVDHLRNINKLLCEKKRNSKELLHTHGLIDDKFCHF